MDDLSLVIMEKEEMTGYLSQELGSYHIEVDAELIDRVFAVNEDGSKVVHMYITTPGDFKDWEYNAILDNYEMELYEGIVLSIEEDEDSYNPGWHVRFNFDDNDDLMEEKLNSILKIHSGEVQRVLSGLGSMEDIYNQ
jgi:hypothetical protein